MFRACLQGLSGLQLLGAPGMPVSSDDGVMLPAPCTWPPPRTLVAVCRAHLAASA